MSKTLITDLYQLTMNAVYQQQKKNEVSTFDLFIRKLPENWGYFVAAGLEGIIDYVEHLWFTQEDFSYLRMLNIFNEQYLKTLNDFHFTGDVWAMPEGTIAFPNEPLLRVTAPLMEAQLLETYLLNKVNFQTMIATKASRVVLAAQGKPVIDFGLRRAHDESAGINGARAAYIGGCIGTSNVEAGRLYGIPVKGTHAHSFVLAFDSELDAFRAYAQTFPENATLLIDTYDVMQGAKNAVTVAREMENRGEKLSGVRLDSGDFIEQSKAVRKMLDDANLGYVKIIASNDLNEYKIKELLAAGAPIDAFGVGTEMITSRDCPALSGVYKLVEINGMPKMKHSEGKKTLPGKKQVYRSRNFLHDCITLDGENACLGNPLLVPVFLQGKLVYQKPALAEIQAYAKQQLAWLPETCKKIIQPDTYPVKISKGLEKMVESLNEERI